MPTGNRHEGGALGRKPAPKKPLVLTAGNAVDIIAALSRAVKLAQARKFYAWAGLGIGTGDKHRRKRAEAFPIELHKKILELIWPNLYLPRRKKSRAATAKTWEQRLEILAKRFAAGQELWNAGDVYELDRPPDARRWNGTTNAENKVERKRGRPALRVSLDVSALRGMMDDDPRPGEM